ncbi:ABC transporter ATP-binding protein [Virgibacillus profundi]|uniref:ABC transporter ATP-binding protein n=1 Tax=Virgibacillus profundi TaxID=2024555 RepID=A0A2A2IF89_9BACI|nr:ABC transporter permease [Virgibacillus profundi]PAV30429.1 ABC transporter ATP-binding protein [Virgibacillus profundi]PXY54601.1 ABC transporter permease [Virgibacillus profundi]
MHFVKHLLLFIKNNFLQLRRKWLSLPLLLLFPILIVGLVAGLIITFITPDDSDPIYVGLVDNDQSKETQLVVELIDQSSQLSSFIQINKMSEAEAANAIKKDELTSYITFPNNFTNNLYQGEPVKLPIVANPNRSTESYLVKELIESITRHISASQANILTINYYAKELNIDDDIRNDLLFEQFKEFLFYTIGKDKIINEQEITNNATASPIHYYGIASWFIILTIWLLAIYNFLCKENTIHIKQRMRLYGITDRLQITARMIVSLLITMLFSACFFAILNHLLEWNLILEDYVRISFLLLLYSIIFLTCLAIIEVIIPSQKFRLLGQSFLTGLILLVSGAIIPTIYFPVQIQQFLPYVFSFEALSWLQEISLNDRLYADFYPLLIMSVAGLFLLYGISIWKERVQE